MINRCNNILVFICLCHRLDLGAPFFTGAPAELWHHPLAYADMPTAATATALQHAALVHPGLHPHPQQVVCEI